MSIVINTKKIPYDTLSPSQNMAEFLSFCRDVKGRYEGNIRETDEKEAQLQDLEHYAELHRDLDGNGGYALYKQIRDTRRQRRAYKSENELLQPIYEWIAENEQALNKLTAALWRVRKTAEIIDNRKYMTRTDVLGEKTDI